jgi:ATP/maltotriose-dependent transcriptional regulator MalT
VGGGEEGRETAARLAHELWLLGERDRARSVLTDALREARRVGLPEALARVEFELAELARATGDRTETRERLESVAARMARAHAAPQFFALIANSFGYLATAGGDLAAARGHHTEALDRALSSADAPVVGQVLVGFAELVLAEGDPERAARLLGAADGVRGGPDDALLDTPRVTAAVRAALGDAAFGAAYKRGHTIPLDGVRTLARVRPDA